MEFFTPPHQLLICSERTELAKFLELLNKLMDRRVMEMLEHIPTIRQVSRPVPKRVKIDLESCTESNLFEDASCRECKLHVKNFLSSSLVFFLFLVSLFFILPWNIISF